LGMPSRRTNNFPESGRGLGHVTPTIVGSTVGYPSDSLASCSFSVDVHSQHKFKFTYVHNNNVQYDVTVTTARCSFSRTLAAPDSMSSGFSVLLSANHRRRPAQHKPEMLGQTTGSLAVAPSVDTMPDVSARKTEHLPLAVWNVAHSRTARFGLEQKHRAVSVHCRLQPTDQLLQVF